MTPIYVTLERNIGSTSKRAISNGLEIVIPEWDGSKFNTPKGFDIKGMGAFYAKYLRQGEIILVNIAGGWNMLLQTDKILSMGCK